MIASKIWLNQNFISWLLGNLFSLLYWNRILQKHKKNKEEEEKQNIGKSNAFFAETYISLEVMGNDDTQKSQ